MMTRFRHAAAASLFFLAACSGTQLGGGTAAVVGALDPALLPALQQTCSAAAPILTQGTAPTAPAKVSSIAGYAASYCTQLAAGVTPPTTNSNTPSWLSGVLNAVQIAAQVAGMVMPLVALF